MLALVSASCWTPSDDGTLLISRRIDLGNEGKHVKSTSTDVSPKLTATARPGPLMATHLFVVQYAK